MSKVDTLGVFELNLSGRFAILAVAHLYNFVANSKATTFQSFEEFCLLRNGKILVVGFEFFYWLVHTTTFEHKLGFRCIQCVNVANKCLQKVFHHFVIKRLGGNACHFAIFEATDGNAKKFLHGVGLQLAFVKFQRVAFRCRCINFHRFEAKF